MVFFWYHTCKVMLGAAGFSMVFILPHFQSHLQDVSIAIIWNSNCAEESIIQTRRSPTLASSVTVFVSYESCLLIGNSFK